MLWQEDKLYVHAVTWGSVICVCCDMRVRYVYAVVWGSVVCVFSDMRVSYMCMLWHDQLYMYAVTSQLKIKAVATVDCGSIMCCDIGAIRQRHAWFTSDVHGLSDELLLKVTNHLPSGRSDSRQYEAVLYLKLLKESEILLYPTEPQPRPLYYFIFKKWCTPLQLS